MAISLFLDMYFEVQKTIKNVRKSFSNKFLTKYFSSPSNSSYKLVYDVFFKQSLCLAKVLKFVVSCWRMKMSLMTGDCKLYPKILQFLTLFKDGCTSPRVEDVSFNDMVKIIWFDNSVNPAELFKHFVTLSNIITNDLHINFVILVSLISVGSRIQKYQAPSNILKLVYLLAWLWFPQVLTSFLWAFYKVVFVHLQALWWNRPHHVSSNSFKSFRRTLILGPKQVHIPFSVINEKGW